MTNPSNGICSTDKSALDIKGKINARNKEYAKQAAGMYKGMFG